MMKIILLASPLLLDSFTCVIQRLLANENIFVSHSLHLYQRLNQNGWPHAYVASIYIVSTMIISLVCILRNWFLIGLSLIILLLFGFYLDKNHSISFKG